MEMFLALDVMISVEIIRIFGIDIKRIGAVTQITVMYYTKFTVATAYYGGVASRHFC